MERLPLQQQSILETFKMSHVVSFQCFKKTNLSWKGYNHCLCCSFDNQITDWYRGNICQQKPFRILSKFDDNYTIVYDLLQKKS